MEIGYDMHLRARLPYVQHSTFSLETFGNCIKLGFWMKNVNVDISQEDKTHHNNSDIDIDAAPKSVDQITTTEN